MITLSLNLALELTFTCVQCGQEMLIEGQKQMNPKPVLKCPGCGFRIQVQQGPGVQIPGAQDKRFPGLKPKRF